MSSIAFTFFRIRIDGSLSQLFSSPSLRKSRDHYMVSTPFWIFYFVLLIKYLKRSFGWVPTQSSTRLNYFYCYKNSFRLSTPILTNKKLPVWGVSHYMSSIAFPIFRIIKSSKIWEKLFDPHHKSKTICFFRAHKNKKHS